MPERGSPRRLLPSRAMRWVAHQVLRSPWPSACRGRAACSHARHQCGSHDETAAMPDISVAAMMRLQPAAPPQLHSRAADAHFPLSRPRVILSSELSHRKARQGGCMLPHLSSWSTTLSMGFS